MRGLLGFFLCLMAINAMANDRLYGEVQLGVASVTHSGINFYPSFGSLSAGAFVAPNIGIEVFADGLLATGTEGDFEMAITQAVGVAVRLRSPPKDGLHAYVLLGLVDFELQQDESNDRNSPRVRQDFTGLRVSLGMAQRLRAIPQLLFTGEYRNYYSDDGIQVDGFSLGLRVNVR